MKEYLMIKFKHLFFLGIALFPALAFSAPSEVEIVIKNNRFEPATVVIPAGTKVKLKVINTDPTPEEFESYTLNREKIIPGNSSAIIFVGPLDAGEHEFFGEFHEDTARGKIIVK